MMRKAAVTARVEPAIKKAIEKLARGDGRSVGQYVERILLSHLESKRPKVKR